jgi:ammonia channel protein AmtB
MTSVLTFSCGGTGRSKNALNTMMSFSSLDVVGVVWSFSRYSHAFEERGAFGRVWIGGLDHMFRGVGL